MILYTNYFHENLEMACKQSCHSQSLMIRGETCAQGWGLCPTPVSAWRVPKGNAVLRPDFYCSNPGAVWSIGFRRTGGDIGDSADRDFPDLIARQRTRPCSSYFTRAGGGCPESCGLAHIPRIFLQFFSPLNIDKCCFVKCDCCTPTGTVIGISSAMRERPSSLFFEEI